MFQGLVGMCYQGLKHQQQFPLGRGDMGHQLSSPNPLKELRHQRVAKERPIAKPLLTVRNGCCIHITGGVRQTPSQETLQKGKNWSDCAGVGSRLLSTHQHWNPNHFAQWWSVQPKRTVQPASTYQEPGPKRLAQSGQHGYCPPFWDRAPSFFFTALWNIKIAVDRIKNTNISSLDVKVPC